MELPEAFYATAAGTFPLLVVAVVVSIRFTFGKANKIGMEYLQHVNEVDALANDVIAKMDERKTLIKHAANEGNHELVSEGLEGFQSDAESLAIVQALRARIPRTQARISGLTRFIKIWTCGFAVMFGIGESASFLALAVGYNKGWIHNYIGPIAVGALAPMITLSAMSLVTQALYAEADE